MKIKLNIIPEYKKKEIRHRSIFLKLMHWNFEFLAVYALFMLTLFAVGYILKLNLQTNIIQLNPNNIAKFSEFQIANRKIKETNSDVAEIKKIQRGQLYWTKLFSKLEKIIPEGIVITDVATKDYNILLSGHSNSRDNLLTLKENILMDECFIGVDLPLSYLVPKENLDFQITFSFEEGCLK